MLLMHAINHIIIPHDCSGKYVWTVTFTTLKYKNPRTLYIYIYLQNKKDRCYITLKPTFLFTYARVG